MATTMPRTFCLWATRRNSFLTILSLNTRTLDYLLTSLDASFEKSKIWGIKRTIIAILRVANVTKDGGVLLCGIILETDSIGGLLD
jgi:hypothetical protein